MSHFFSTTLHNFTIPQIVEQLHERSGLKYVMVRQRMSAYLTFDYGEDTFQRKFRREDASARYETDEVLALIRAFTEGLSDERRCKAEDAFRLFSLARIALDDVKLLKPLFPEPEYRAAWDIYRDLEQAGSESQIESDPNFLKPLYPQVFIGRDSDITRIKARLGVTSGTERHPLTVVRGWPGVGKTTFVNRLIHDEKAALNSSFPDGVLWASLGPEGDVLYALKKWARQIGAVHIESLQRTEDVIDFMRHALEGKRVLLIVDDVWTEPQGNAFRSLESEQTTFLFTTRFTELADSLGETRDNVLVLDVLNNVQSLELIRVFAPKASQEYAAQLDRLVETLEGLPLALRVAGTLIENEYYLGFDVINFIEELQENFGAFKYKAPSDRFDEVSGQTPTIGMLFRRSVKTLPGAEQVSFACMGGFAPKPAEFDLRAMAAICDLADPVASARALVARGLLEPLGQGRFQMHYTLSMYARHLLDTNLQELAD